jgi:hypothetical protein
MRDTDMIPPQASIGKNRTIAFWGWDARPRGPRRSRFSAARASSYAGLRNRGYIS